MLSRAPRTPVRSWNSTSTRRREQLADRHPDDQTAARGRPPPESLRLPPGSDRVPRVGREHLDSARTLAEEDPDGAYTLLYDAARKSLAALLQAQGLRATSSGGHYAIQEAIAAQFTKPPPRDAFHPFGRLRRTRNQIEYDEISPITADDVRADLRTVRALHATAHQLTPEMPIFTD